MRYLRDDEQATKLKPLIIHKPVDISVPVAPDDENDAVKLTKNTNTRKHRNYGRETWRYLISVRGIQENSCCIECDAGSIVDRITENAGG